MDSLVIASIKRMLNYAKCQISFNEKCWHVFLFINWLGHRSQQIKTLIQPPVTCHIRCIIIAIINSIYEMCFTCFHCYCYLVIFPPLHLQYKYVSRAKDRNLCLQLYVPALQFHCYHNQISCEYWTAFLILQHSFT